ncbi:MAG: hypothetical protein ACK4HV_01150, partial [Parachlamydiaceae bacterium]
LAATSDCLEEINDKIRSCNMPRCAIIALLFMGKRFDALVVLAETKLSLFRYDFVLRDALISYYLKTNNYSDAKRQLELYEKGKAPSRDEFFVRAKYFLMIGEPLEARRLVEDHQPTSLVCYIRMINLLKQIDDSEESRYRLAIDGVKHYPKSLYLLRELSHYYASENRNEECDAILGRILLISPNDQEALVMKATFASTFKEAKNYLNRLESDYPDILSTLSIGCAVRYEFAEEMNKALRDINKLRAMEKKRDLVTEKLFVDILIYLEQYDEVLKLWSLNDPKFRHIYLFRAAISYLRKDQIEQASRLVSDYEEAGELSEFERFIKGELLVAQEKYEEAYSYLIDLDPKLVHVHFKTIKAYFKCLKALNKGQEALKVFDQIPLEHRGFYGEFFDWFTALRKPPSVSKPIKKVVQVEWPTFVTSIEKKEKKIKEKGLVERSKNAIPLEKGVFSDARTIGVDPLFRRKAKEVANELIKNGVVMSYPADYIPFLNDAIKSLERLSACTHEPFEMQFHVINFLSKLQAHLEGAAIFSSKVMNVESIRHSLKLISEYPHLITPKSLLTFVQDALRLLNALKKSKREYANIEELTSYPIEDSSAFEALDRDKKVKTLIAFIQEKLKFLVECKFNFIDFDEDKESKIIMLQVWALRAAIRSIYRYDIDKGIEIRNLFPEFKKEFKALCYSQGELDGVNFEMAAYIYLSARCRISELDLYK